MDKNVTIYRAKKSAMSGGLFILTLTFFGFTLPLLIAGDPVEPRKLVGLLGFWVTGIILTILPLTFKLEIGNGYVRFYAVGLCYRNLHSTDIQVLEYGNLMRAGGLGYGKGLKGWEKRKYGSKYFSIGEKLYGKEAIQHAKRVLEAHVITKKII
ncbi:MAG: hypothetical protein HYT94_04210 [Parcubacteria group bacterium]|nr:hypothetical protein [Parcubacteria group bacterium]